jgi:hypothetical protein
MEIPRCIKCGRRLKSPESIALGIGPKCAGASGSSRSMKVRLPGRNGFAYSLRMTGNLQQHMPIGATPIRRISRRELIRRKKEERRRLFDARLPFQCGVLVAGRRPLVYIPLPDDTWKEEHTGRTIPHARLQNYLQRYGLI